MAPDEMVFVDTSAFYALFDRNDGHHADARASFLRLKERLCTLATSSYVRLETWALLQRRLGLEAANVFRRDFLPLCTCLEITETLFENAASALLAANRRDLSIVDMTSFLLLRDHGISRVFAYDEHFAEQGFTTRLEGA